MATLRAAKVLRRGGLLAHQTGTVAGVAAHPSLSLSAKKIQSFKQRSGPFLLLADSPSTALKQARYISLELRQLVKQHWPGPVTLVFSAKQHLAVCAYKKGCMAVRVDADIECRRLAKLCGGLLLSSSFNRRSKALMPLEHQVLMRYSNLLDARLMPEKGRVSNQIPSKIFKISASKVQRLR
ncbi:MAG: Sua5/YciO/YrdC/YwlC family protein [Mariprofundaceae bacterium]